MNIQNNLGNLQEANLNIALTCSVGLENLIAQEVTDCGGKVLKAGSGLVTASGNAETAYRCCLWSRFASRVLVEFLEFEISSEEDLYQKLCQVNWKQVFSVDSTFAVNCTLSKTAVVQHNQYAALKVKDAIVDIFREEVQQRPTVQPRQPDIQFYLHIEAQTARLYIDFSGESLHRRGYRDATGIAPLKETLGAGIVALSGWQNAKCDLLDPMCGSGTLLIEAAMMFGDVAPGLSRKYFGFKGWLGHDENLWQQLVTEAIEREDVGLEQKWPAFRGYDNDQEAVRAARKNIARAGLEKYIHIEQTDLAFIPAAKRKDGFILSNLPYGERLSEKESVSYLYRAVGKICRERFTGWTAGLFISDPSLTDRFSINFPEKYKLFNGPISCRLLVGKISPPEDKFSWELSAVPTGKADDAFANRFRKNIKSVFKWARKNDIECYRVYDKDLPDYNIAVDIYGKWVHVQEYAPPKSVDPEVAEKRFNDAVQTIKDVLSLRSDRIFFKRRQRQRGKQQYTKQSNRGRFYEVQEGDCAFLVNFTDYLDTGLFLDHRPVRMKISKEADKKNFLNLFGYTGTATVHAAKGGALSTTTVDLSGRYLQWARCNLALNGVGEKNHRLITSDVTEWLKKDDGQYDIIFMDPPTFSNTKKEKLLFDVQKDHQAIIRLAARRLTKNGILLFSTNSRKFILSDQITSEYRVRDISRETIPYDFSRNPRIHQCWEICK